MKETAVAWSKPQNEMVENHRLPLSQIQSGCWRAWSLQAKMVSSRLFLVRMVPGLCWASGWLASSGGHVETGLSKMACFRS